MKIYFAGSIRGGCDDVDLYLQIIEHLKKYGEVLTEHIGNKNLEISGENTKDDTFIHYKCRVPKVFLERVSPTLGIPYRVMYEEPLVEEVVSSDSGKSNIPTVPAGEKIPAPEIELLEITLRCDNTDCELYEVPYKEITSDLFASLSNVCCGKCGNTKMTLMRCEAIVTEKK